MTFPVVQTEELDKQSVSESSESTASGSDDNAKTEIGNYIYLSEKSRRKQRNDFFA